MIIRFNKIGPSRNNQFKEALLCSRQRILPKKLYQSHGIDETNYSDKAKERKEKMDKIALLLSEECEESVALETLDLSRATYYRWKRNYKRYGLEGLEDENRSPRNVRKTTWSKEIEDQIYHLRKQYPLFGKQKIAVMYERKYKRKISESTTGMKK